MTTLSWYVKKAREINCARCAISFMVFYGIIVIFAMKSCFDFAILPPSNINSTGMKPNDTTNTQYYWNSTLHDFIMGAFLLGFLCTLVFGGRISENYGSKWPYGLSILGTSILTILIPLIARLDPAYLIVVRFFQGYFEGITIPSSFTLMTKWIPPLEGNLIFAIACGGIDIGLFVPHVLSVFLRDWDLLFYIIGCAGFIWFLLMIVLVYDSPYDHPRISSVERNYIIGTLNGTVDNRNLKGVPVPWKDIMSSSAVWVMLAARFGYSWAMCVFQKFLPNFGLEYNYFNVQLDLVWYLAPYFGDILVGIIVAIIIDYSRKKNYCSNTFARKLCTLTGGLVSAFCCVLIANFMNYKEMISICYVVAISVSAFTDSGCLLNEVDLSPRFSGTLYGIGYLVSNVADLLAVHINNAILSFNWSAVLYTTFGVRTVTSLLFAVYGSGEVQCWNLIASFKNKQLLIQK